MTWLKRCFLLCLVCFQVLADDDDLPVEQKTAENDSPALMLKPQTQQQSGIATLKLQAVRHPVEVVAYGKVLTLQPLMALRQRYLTALTERATAQAKFQQTTQNIKRQQTLYEEGITAKRDLETQQAQWQTEKAQLAASHYQDEAIKNEALLQWGSVLTGWILANNSKQLNDLLSGQTKLLQITLPSNQAWTDKVKTIHVSPSGQRDRAFTAEFISIAPQTEVSTQSHSYFFQTKTKNIGAGMNLSAWLPQQQAELDGVIIPKSALLWAMDQAFVYVKTDDSHFTRRPVLRYTTSKDGYFVSEGSKPNEEVVITGGQLLLSEQMRGQIPDED